MSRFILTRLAMFVALSHLCYCNPLSGGMRIPCQHNNPWTTRFKRQIQDSPCGGGWWPSPSPQYYYYPQYLPWDTAAYYGWSYPQQQQPYPQQWPIDPLQPETSDLYPSYAPQPQQNLYPDQEETSLDWYPPQARPAYEDYFDCSDPCNCYGSCGDYTYTDTDNIDECHWKLPGWATIGGKKLYLSTADAGLTWYEAEAKALELGGHLFKMVSEEDEQVLSEVKKCFSSGTGVWVGGNDIANTGRWVWTDGEPLAKRLVERIADNTIGHCLQAKAEQINGTPCDDKAGFLVAEYEVEPSETSTRPPFVPTPASVSTTTTTQGGTRPGPE